MKLIAICGLFALIALGQSKYTGPINQAGLDLIKEFEGWYPNFYTDPVGIKTIGYGHACHVWNCAVPLNGKYPVPLSLANGQALLNDDLNIGGYSACAANHVSYSGLNANQYSALVSFIFNLGCGAFQGSTLRSLLNNGNVEGASKEFGKWVYGGGVVLPGLVRRREAERVLFCTGGVCGSSSSCTGRVVADGGLNIRATPNTSGAITGSLTNGQTITINGRTTGSNVNGNANWFQISGGYVAAYYITISTSNGQSWCAK